jgi:hypothetical protein
LSFEARVFLINVDGDGITIDTSNGLFSIDDYSKTPDGNCTEATFRCVPKNAQFPITPRSVLFIQTRPNSTTSFTTVWRGIIVLAGNPRSDKVEVFRAVGLKERFYETLLTKDPVIKSADVAVMAEQVIDGFARAQNRGLSFGGLSGTKDIPTVNFTFGDRFPLLESSGAALDALAASVGSFIVPTGDTYAYDGVTYTAGQVVPKMTWGVRGDGSIFFKRLAPNAVSVDETDLNVDVTYPALSGEELVDAPVLVYYPGVDPAQFTSNRLQNTSGLFTAIEPVYYPICVRPTQTRANGSGQRRVQIPNPDDYIVSIRSQIYSETGPTTDMLDGNPATFGQLNSATSINYLLNTVEAGIVLRMDIEYGNTSGFRGRIDVFVGGAGARSFNSFFTLQPQDSFVRRQLDFVFPVPLQWFLANNVDFGTDPIGYGINGFYIDGPNGSGGVVNIYDIRPFAVRTSTDNSVALQLQSLYAMEPAEAVTTVKLFSDEPLHTQVDLTPVGGGLIEVPVERVQYSVTTAEGVTTTYHAGQPFDGQLVSERVVLEGLARRAVGGM